MCCISWSSQSGVATLDGWGVAGSDGIITLCRAAEGVVGFDAICCFDAARVVTDAVGAWSGITAGRVATCPTLVACVLVRRW